MDQEEANAWPLPAVISDAIATAPDGWKLKLTKFIGQVIGSKFPETAVQIADHVDTLRDRSLVRHELAKAAAAKAIKNPELVDRTLARLCDDLLDKQQNIENIARLAAEEIVNDCVDPPVSDVSDDWRRKFSSYAEDVSDPEMQRVWAKILSGEFHNPGTFSFRTLRIMSEINKEVAEIFSRVSKFRFDSETIFVETKEWKSGLNYHHLNILEDWGLIHEIAGERTRIIQKENFRYEVWGQDHLLIVFSKGGINSIKIPVIRYTESGSELAKLIPKNDEVKVLRKIASFLMESINHSEVAVILNIVEISGNFIATTPYIFLWGDQTALDESMRNYEIHSDT